MMGVWPRAGLAVAALLLAVIIGGCRREAPSTPLPPLMRGVLGYGQRVESALAEVESRWLFVGERDDVISVTLNGAAGAEHPALVVLGPGGDAIGRAGPLSGQVSGLRLAESGQHTIAVSPGTGAYTLSLALERAASAPTATLPPTPSAPPPGRRIALGEAGRGTLAEGDSLELWAFEGRAGEVITIFADALSPDLRPVLRLYDPERTLIASDANPNGSTRGQIAGFALPRAGLYTVQVWGSGGVGDYALSILDGAPPPTPTFTPPPTMTARPAPTAIPSPTPTSVAGAAFGALLQFGQPVQGRLERPDQVDRFAVFAPAGTVISVGLFAEGESGLLPALELYAPSGERIAEAAATADTAREALVSEVRLPATGAYILFVGSASDAGTGMYTLVAAQQRALREVGGGSLPIGQTYQGVLPRRGDRETWLVEMPENMTFALEVTPLAEALALALEVIGPDGTVLALAESAPGEPVALPPQTTLMAGRYQVRITAAGNQATGRYLLASRVISVVPTATFFPVNLEQRITLRQGERFVYTFRAVPGDVVRVEALADSPTLFDPVIALYGPGGQRVALVDDISATNTDAILQVALAEGIGEYRVEAYGYALMPGSFTLRLRTQ